MNWKGLTTIVLLAFLCCCNKNNSSNNNVVNPPATTGFGYYLSYDPVISIYANSNFNFPFFIIVDSGDISTNPLTVTITSLPAYTSCTPSSLIVTQLLGGVLNIKVGNLAAGTYKMQLVINGTANGSKSHNLFLKINPLPDYSALLARTYTGCYDFCTPINSLTYYTSVVTKIVDTPYKISISNIKKLGSSFVVRAWLSNIVTIPRQTIGPYTIWGSGTFGKDSRAAFDSLYTMTINDTLVSGVDTQYCTVHVQH